MIDKRTIFEIHRLKNLHFSERRIAQELRIGRNTVSKYLENPDKHFTKPSPRPSKLDPYRDLIDEFLEQDPLVKAPVLLQRLQQKGFDGKITILRDYLQKIRGQIKYREPFIRIESPPGKQMQIDWGHFGSLSYEDNKRKLYALAVIESYSRIIYVQFTHRHYFTDKGLFLENMGPGDAYEIEGSLTLKKLDKAFMIMVDIPWLAAGEKRLLAQGDYRVKIAGEFAFMPQTVSGYIRCKNLKVRTIDSFSFGGNVTYESK